MAGTDAALPPSLWVATTEPGPACPPLEGVAEADVAIVGGGFTGLSAALHLAEAGCAVRLLEAAEPGWGASGRNGGQVNPGWKILPDEIMARFGPDRGRRIVAMADATCELVFDLIARHDIACDALRPGFVLGAYGRHGLAKIADWTGQWSALGAPVECLERREAADLLGTDAYDGALLDRRGGNLQPLSYARGLARAALAAGATIHGATPALALERQGAEWQVGTPHGRVRARHVLLCTNAYTDQLWPGLGRTVVPVTSVVTATRPLGGALLQSILPGRHAVTETRRVIVYYRRDRDGRFVIGGRGSFWSRAEQVDMAHIRAAARHLFPGLKEATWDHQWGGKVAVTPDTRPKLLGLAPGVFAGLGYNGRGVAMATMMGKQLATTVLGDDPDMVVEPLDPIPLHAFNQLGVSWRLATGRLLDRLDGAKV